MPIRFAMMAVLCSTAVAHADDWPQWMGPKRDNVWREAGIIDSFPKDGPKVLWRAPVAGGYAGPAVSGGMVFVADYVSPTITDEMREGGNFDRKAVDGTERVLAFDESTGKQLWEYKYPVKYAISYPAGPRCTPLVQDGKVYTLGAEGHLACLNAKTGAKIWAKELKIEYKTKSAIWGYAAHPMIDGQKLITLGGGEGSHVIALDKDTGAEIWKSQTDSDIGYSPVRIVELNGARQLLAPGPKGLRSLDPETGARLWFTPYNGNNTSMIMTPIVYQDYIFVGGYQGKNLLVQLGKNNEVKVVWKDKKDLGISPVNVQPFLIDNIIYGYNENGDFLATELPSGKRLWTVGGPVGEDPKGSETAFINQVGDRFIFFTERGDLVFGTLSPKGYEEQSRANVIATTNAAFGRKVVWCAPAYANKHAYIRNDKELICVDLAK